MADSNQPKVKPTVKKVFILCSFIPSFFLLFACREAPKEGDVIIHPVKEKIPHSGVPSKMLEVLDAGDHLENFPSEINLLHQILNGNVADQDSVELDILTSSELDLSSINDSTLLILDKEQNRLIRYNMYEHKSEIIAEQGRGPGDLFFSKELSVNSGRAYIGMQGHKISVFNCQKERYEHEKIIQTKYNNYSLSPTDDFIYVLGISPFGRQQDPDPENTDQHTIHKVNHEGDIDLSFLPIYDDRSPIVRDRIMSEGSVRSFPEFDTTIITFQYFPYLFVHSLGGRLLDKYKLPAFKEAKNIESKVGELGTTLTFNGDYTYLRYTKKINEEWLLLKIQEFRDVNYVFSDQEIYGDTWYSYYIYSLDSEKFYKIGDDVIKPYGQPRIFYLIKSGVIMNRNGKLYLMNI